MMVLMMMFRSHCQKFEMKIQAQNDNEGQEEGKALLVSQ